MAIDVQKFLRVYRTVNTAADILEGKRKLKRAMDTHTSRMSTTLDVTDAGRKIATGDIDRYDVRVACKTTVKHGPRMYHFLAKKIRERKAREDAEE